MMVVDRLLDFLWVELDVQDVGLAFFIHAELEVRDVHDESVPRCLSFFVDCAVTGKLMRPGVGNLGMVVLLDRRNEPLPVGVAFKASGEDIPNQGIRFLSEGGDIAPMDPFDGERGVSFFGGGVD